MVRISESRRKVFELYRDDIQFQFDVVLIEGQNGDITVEGNNSQKKSQATDFLKLVSHDPIRESDYDDVPLQQIFKPIFGQCFKVKFKKYLFSNISFQYMKGKKIYIFLKFRVNFNAHLNLNTLF